MLIRLSVENFKSYKNENSLLMTSSSKIRTLPEHERQVDSLSVMKFAGIFGYNATGKTNILKAASFMKMFVGFNQINDWDFPFIDNEDMPSKIEAIFSSGELVYQYGFSIKTKKDPFLSIQILDEYLNIVGNKIERSKEVYSFSRGLNENLSKPEEASVFNVYLEGYKRLLAEGRPQLFLHFINDSDKAIPHSPLFEKLQTAYSFIKNSLVVIGANSTNLTFIDSDSLTKIKGYVQKFDPSIEDIKLVSVDPDEIQKVLPPFILNDIKSHLLSNKLRPFTVGLNNNNFYFFHASNDPANPFICQTLSIKHRYINTWFSFSKESEGTRKFLILMSCFANDNSNKVFFVDELERSMHPDASRYILDFFSSETKGKDTQFIFTTHNSDFMKSSLRKDEIFFADKDIYGTSILYPLTDFSERGNGTSIANQFLEGRFSKSPKPPYGKDDFDKCRH